jgi:hypothetical protein
MLREIGGYNWRNLNYIGKGN